jgi:hypothetical protein
LRLILTQLCAAEDVLMSRGDKFFVYLDLPGVATDDVDVTVSATW